VLLTLATTAEKSAGERAPGTSDPACKLIDVGLVRRFFSILDSAFVSRVGSTMTLIRMVSLGLALVVLVGLVGAGVVHIGGWIPVVCFVVWALIAVLLTAAWTMRRQPSTLASPLAQLVIARGLPGSSSELLGALVVAESRAREFVAEAAILMPVNNQGEAVQFARSYGAYEAEVASLLARADEFDDRWELLWKHKPSWARSHLLEPPFTRATLDVLTKYIAYRARQLGGMMEFLRSGNEQPVRYIRAWVTHDEGSPDA
jgi:hypothetical protein